MEVTNLLSYGKHPTLIFSVMFSSCISLAQKEIIWRQPLSLVLSLLCQEVPLVSIIIDKKTLKKMRKEFSFRALSFPIITTNPQSFLLCMAFNFSPIYTTLLLQSILQSFLNPDKVLCVQVIPKVSFFTIP